MTIADTDVLIDYLAGRGEADAVLQLLDAVGATLLTRNRRHFQPVPGIRLA